MSICYYSTVACLFFGELAFCVDEISKSCGAKFYSSTDSAVVAMYGLVDRGRINALSFIHLVCELSSFFKL
jgi:hypothetical protein